MKKELILFQLVLNSKKKKRIRCKNVTRFRRFTIEYYLPIETGDVVVCKQCFLHTLGETEGFLRTFINKTWDCTNKAILKDGRGSRTPKNKSAPEKVKEIEDHIATFPVYESICLKGHIRKYLAGDLNVAKMYRLYKEIVDRPLSLKMYRTTFHNTNLKFEVSLDTCSECNELAIKSNYATDETSKEDMHLERDEHEDSVEHVPDETSREELKMETDEDEDSVESVVDETSKEELQLERDEHRDSVEYAYKKENPLLTELAECFIEETPKEAENVDTRMSDNNIHTINESNESFDFDKEKSEEISESNNEANNNSSTTSNQIVSNTIFQKKRTNQRYENKIKRNSGQLYKTKSGKIVEARSVTRLQKCKPNCRLKVTYTDQCKLFNKYWALASYEKRVDFISACIKFKQKKRTRSKTDTKFRRFTLEYYLPIETGDVIVCKQCFLHTLGETDGFLRTFINKSWGNTDKVIPRDGRGLRPPKNKSAPDKVKEIEDHIASFPIYETTCLQGHTRKYLAADLNVARMYRLYKEIVNQPLSLKVYRTIFHNTNLKFEGPLNVCSNCNELATKSNCEADETSKDDLQLETDEPQDPVECAYQEEQPLIIELAECFLEETHKEVENSDTTKSDHNASTINQFTVSFDFDKQKTEDISECNSETDNNLPTTSAQTDTNTSVQQKKTNQRYQNKIKRNTGQPYKSSSGKLVKARTMTRLQKCKPNCRLKVTYTDQCKIFNKYWALASYEKRVDFISAYIKFKKKKRTCSKTDKLRRFTVDYYLPIETGDVNVCKQCFLYTLGETKGFLRTFINKAWSSTDKVIPRDGRGLRSPKNKSSPEQVKEVEDHIASFPVYESNCLRGHSSEKHLPADLTVTNMYRLYKEKVDQPLSLGMYRRIFNKTNLKFKNPLNACSKCDVHTMKSNCSVNASSKGDLQLKKCENQESSEFVNQEKNSLTELSECFLKDYLKEVENVNLL